MRPDFPMLLVVLVGIPGSGKSTLARALISGASSGRPWRRISQDVLGTRKRCIRAAQRAIQDGNHVLVDRCNFDAQQRAHWLELSEHGAADGSAAFDRRIAVYLPVSPEEARRRVLARGTHEGGVDAESMSSSKIGSIVGRMHDDLRLPQAAEGFDEVLECVPGGGGDEVLSRIWALAEGCSDDVDSR